MSATLYDICVYGTVCLDRVRKVNELPPTGGYVEILEEELHAGGEALNSAVALTMWGAKVALVSNAIGFDENADLLMKRFKTIPDLEDRFVRQREDAPTPVCDIYITPDGQRTMFGSGFAHMSTAGVPEEVLEQVKAFTADGNPGESSVNACAQAREAGVPVVSMDMHRSEQACRLSDIILTSSDWLPGDGSIAHLSALADDYRARYGCDVIFTAGEKGCVLARREGSPVEHFPAFRAPKVVDTTGSGDVFRAGLIFSLYLQGQTLEEAIRFGSAAAALNAGAMGAWAGVRDRETIESFIRIAEMQA